MISRVITKIPNPLQLYTGALLTSRKAVKVLVDPPPQLTLECNSIVMESNHLERYSKLCGFKAQDMPLTYPAMLVSSMQMMLMTDKSFPIPLLGMVHLSNKAELIRHFDKRSKINAKVRFSDNYILHEKGVCFTVISELFCGDTAQLLWRSESTILRRGVTLDSKLSQNSKIYNSLLKEESMANVIEMEKWTLSSDLGRKYATISGDYNPIHLSSISAKLFGFQSAIIHGKLEK